MLHLNPIAVFRDVAKHFTRDQLARLRDAIVADNPRLSHTHVIRYGSLGAEISSTWLLPYMLWPESSSPWCAVDAQADMREAQKLINSHAASSETSLWREVEYWWCVSDPFARAARRQDVLTVLHQLIGDSEMDANQKIEQNVDQPSHYCRDGIEVIDVIAAFTSPEKMQGFCHGSAIKYLLRAEHKGDFRKDLLKARNYLERLIELTDPENSRETDGGASSQ